MKILKKANLAPWKVLSKTIVLDNPWFKVRKDNVKIESKNITDDFYVWEESNHSLIVPITPEGEFIMVRQYKHGAASVVNEFPCGLLDPQETFLEAAKRELLEETGYKSLSWHSLGKFSPSASKSTALFEIFIAQECEPLKDYQFGAADQVEEIEIVSYSGDELEKMIKQNLLPCSKSTLAYLLALEFLKKGLG